MNANTWSIIVTVAGMIGFILVGRKLWWAWWVNICAQVLWFIFGLTTHQYGFVVSSVIYFVIFTKNAYDWTGDHRRKPIDIHDRKYQRMTRGARYEAYNRNLQLAVEEYQDGKISQIEWLRRVKEIMEKGY